MKVHFIASRSDLGKDIKYFRKIINIVIDRGHIFTREWVEPTYALMLDGGHDEAAKNADWKKINQENIEAISKADIIIAEATAKSFSTGYQVATALQQKKPILLLTRNDSLIGTFGSGIASDFLRTSDYDLDNLEKILDSFLEENSLDSKDMRFNFFIDRKIHNYLRWASFRTGKTKAEIIRELVMKEIDKKDF